MSSLRAVLFSIFAYYALLMLDTIVKILGLGILGYGNIWFQSAGLILMFVLGIFFLFVAVFNLPTYQTLFSFLCILVFCIYFFEFHLSTFFIGEREVLTKTPFITVAIMLGSNLLTFPLRILRYRND
ncbi:MAG: hypothetical protein JW776_01245 [Candidatus Lokiarchaeota archaeon]|nr:hypothetical protein [Candidatus Lokiarchaeota archaeon]